MEFKYITDFSKMELDENIVIPCRYDGKGCLLIKNRFNKDYLTIRKTDNLEIRLNTIINCENENYYVHIIKSTKDSMESDNQFSIIYEYIFKKITKPIDEAELNGLVSSIEEYFRISPEYSNHSLQVGVFGELLAIEQLFDNGYKQIMEKYHRNFFSIHDIEINDNIRIEVKTTEKKERIHRFSHDQLVRDDISVFVISILLENSEKGTSLTEMFERVIEKCNDADMVFELRKLMLRCGISTNNLGITISLKKAVEDMRVFSAKDMPKLIQIPDGITNVEYSVDCSFVDDFGIQNLIDICMDHKDGKL